MKTRVYSPDYIDHICLFENDLHIEQQTQIQRICDLGKLLGERDQAMVELYLKGDVDYQSIAKLQNTSRVTVARRLRRLLTLLKGGPKSYRSVNTIQAAIVRQAVMQGLSVKRIQLKTGLSRYRITRICKLLGICSVRPKMGGQR